jgi:NADP-dependent 3-hydroxy acid dehydrogenase YdfG
MSREQPAQKRTAGDGLDTRVVVVADADVERGAGIARALASVDASMVLAGMDVDALARLAAELTAAGTHVVILVDDVATDAGREALVEMVNELFPRRNT